MSQLKRYNEGSLIMDKSIFKKSPEELREYLQFKRRGTQITPKKGKGFKYSRKKKHKNKEQ